ncbi:MAG: hypothetical protein Q9164_006453, partial [Protoblastenia rupestris]
MRLEARIARPSMFKKDPLTSAISQVAWSLLDDAGVKKAEEQRLENVHALCDAVAHNLGCHDISDLLQSKHKRKGSFFGTPNDLLAATAAVGNMHKLRSLLSKRADPNVESEYF